MSHPQTASRSQGPVNHLKKVRNEKMLSKAELARKAGLSVLTIDRIERGHNCRDGTKRKILEALEISIPDRDRVFPRQIDSQQETQQTEEKRSSSSGTRQPQR